MTERLSNKQQMTGEKAGRRKRGEEVQISRNKGEGTGKYVLKVISWLHYSIKSDVLIVFFFFFALCDLLPY